MNLKFTFFLCAIIASFVLTSCFNMFPCVKGSGEIIKEERDVDSFNKIELETMGDIYIKQGEENALRVETDDNVIDLVKTEVKNDKLVIYSEKNICPEKLRFDLIVRDLNSIIVTGSGNIKTINDFTAEDFEIKILGSGDVRISEINARNIELEVSGSGDVMLKGKSDRLITEINGSGDINAFGLEVKDVMIEINGSGDLSIHATNKLHIEINGSGDIVYKGDPEIKQEIFGSGDIIKK